MRKILEAHIASSIILILSCICITAEENKQDTAIAAAVELALTKERLDRCSEELAKMKAEKAAQEEAAKVARAKQEKAAKEEAFFRNLQAAKTQAKQNAMAILGGPNKR